MNTSGTVVYLNGTKLTDVSLTTATKIGSYGFDNYSSLSSISLGDSVVSTGVYALRHCTSLSSISIGKGLASVGHYALTQNTSLATITVDSGNTHYKTINGALMSYDGTVLMVYPAGASATSYAVPSGCTTVNLYAFYSSTVLKTITFPSTVTSIGESALMESGIESVEFPGSSVLGPNCCYGCASLTTAVLDSGITTTPDRCFYNCVKLTSVTLPETITILGYSLFGGCTGLQSITLPSAVTTLSQTFKGCTGLSSVSLPSSLTRLQYSALSGCSSLKSITIPSGVTAIASSAFLDTSLTTLTMLPSTPPSLASGVFNIAPTSIVVPAGTLAAYQAATNWSAYASNMKEAS
jgi:hypothetical protein